MRRSRNPLWQDVQDTTILYCTKTSRLFDFILFQILSFIVAQDRFILHRSTDSKLIAFNAVLVFPCVPNGPGPTEICLSGSHILSKHTERTSHNPSSSVIMFHTVRLPFIAYCLCLLGMKKTGSARAFWMGSPNAAVVFPMVKINDSIAPSKNALSRLQFKSSDTRVHNTIGPFDDEECSLEDSVLADCDTLPEFKTAHGILCPDTVARMDRNTHGGRNNKAVKAFLDRYRHCGPLSCVELLSDPEILPHLTKAMRDLA